MARRAKPNKSNEKDDQQKQRIFRAAQEVFSNKGYRGGTTREIAEKAEVNLAAIHYYWGSKDELFRAVHQHLYDNLTPIFLDLIPKMADYKAQDIVYEGVSRAADFLAGQPEVARLDVHTVVDRRTYDLPLDHNNLENLLGLLRTQLAPLQKSGVLHKDVDLEMLAMCLTASFDYFFAAEDLVGTITSGKAQDPAILQRYKNFVTRMVTTYVGIAPPRPKPVPGKAK